MKHDLSQHDKVMSEQMKRRSEVVTRKAKTEERVQVDEIALSNKEAFWHPEYETWIWKCGFFFGL